MSDAPTRWTRSVLGLEVPIAAASDLDRPVVALLPWFDVVEGDRVIAYRCDGGCGELLGLDVVRDLIPRRLCALCMTRDLLWPRSGLPAPVLEVLLEAMREGRRVDP